MILLMGPEKAGKSFLAWDIATRVARGQDVIDYHTTGKHNVLYLNMDMGESVMRDRLRDLKTDGYEINAPQLMLIHPDDERKPFDILDAMCYAWMKEAVRETDPSLIIIDILREAHGADENDSTQMKHAFDAFQRVFQGRSVIFVHHTKKINPEFVPSNPRAFSRGSSYITGKVDGLWLLFDNTLRIVSRFGSERTIFATQGSNGIWAFPHVAKETQEKHKVMSLCARYPSLSHADISKKAEQEEGMTRTAFYKALQGVTCIHRNSTTT